MTDRPYRRSRRLGDVLRARFRSDPSLTLEGARAELTREVVTEDAIVTEELPRGFRITKGHRDIYYIEAGNDFCRDADLYWFTPCATRPPSPPADPHPPKPAFLARRRRKKSKEQPKAAPASPLKVRDRRKIEAIERNTQRKAQSIKRIAAVEKWLADKPNLTKAESIYFVECKKAIRDLDLGNLKGREYLQGLRTERKNRREKKRPR